jgi:ribosome-binding factor A
LFQVKDVDKAMDVFENRKGEIKRELTARVKHQLRRMPELRFFHDDTLDHVFRIEELFKQINEDKLKAEGDSAETSS